MLSKIVKLVIVRGNQGNSKHHRFLIKPLLRNYYFRAEAGQLQKSLFSYQTFIKEFLCLYIAPGLGLSLGACHHPSGGPVATTSVVEVVTGFFSTAVPCDDGSTDSIFIELCLGSPAPCIFASKNLPKPNHLPPPTHAAVCHYFSHCCYYYHH